MRFDKLREMKAVSEHLFHLFELFLFDWQNGTRVSMTQRVANGSSNRLDLLKSVTTRHAFVSVLLKL